jgi:uncharacterized protein YkwD
VRVGLRRYRRLAGIAFVCAIAPLAAGCAQMQARVHAGSVPYVSTVLPSENAAAENAVIARVNQLRAQHGLVQLAVHPTLVNKARAWARWMAGGGCGRDASKVPYICHSSLAEGINAPWMLLEENVGSGSPASIVMGVQTGFEHSPLHLANIMNGRVRYIGVGVAYWNDHVYVTQEFMATS